MDKADKAKQALVHYLRQIYQVAGLHWDSDNASEIEELVDLIIEAAIERAEKKVRNELAG